MMFERLRRKAILFFVLMAFFSTLPVSSVHAQSRAPRGATVATADSPPLGKSSTEKQILAVLDDLDRNQGCVI